MSRTALSPLGRSLSSGLPKARPGGPSRPSSLKGEGQRPSPHPAFSTFQNGTTSGMPITPVTVLRQAEALKNWPR